MKFERQKIRTKDLPPVLMIKWNRQVLDEGFVPFPKRLLRCCRALFKGPTKMSQLVAVMAIVDFQRPGMTKPPSLDFLAFMAGMPTSKFQKTLDELETAGWIKVESEDGRLKIDYSGLLKEVIRLTKDDD